MAIALNSNSMTNKIALTEDHITRFSEDGFVVVENWLDAKTVELARERFKPLFSGQFELGIQPDEWNWREGRDSPELTRQICNAWKSDRIIRSIVLMENLGRICAVLKGWPGARLNQDNVIWKPAGASALGFHQDDSYQSWLTPPEMLTCWMTLDDTLAEQGTIEYVRGSHLWSTSQPIKQFHAPDDPLAELESVTGRNRNDLDIVPIVVNAGSAVFHHGRTWHGSKANTGVLPRRSVVSHCMSSDARFSTTSTSSIYSRYKKTGTDEMDESFFPIIYRQDGYRSPELD